MTSLQRCYNVADLRDEAKRRLPKWIFEFVDRGTEDEIALTHIRHALNRIKLRNRALIDMSGRDLTGTLFGQKTALPAVIAPTGSAGLCWYQGELALAKAAAKFGIPFAMANGSNTKLETIAEQAGGRLWLQLYIWENRELTHNLVRRAAGMGYEAVIVTTDLNLGVNREFNRRNGQGNPFKPSYRTVRDIVLKPGWMTNVLFKYLVTTGIPKQANNPPEFAKKHGSALRGDKGSITWDDFGRLRDVWKGKLIIKGITRASDAAKAVALGADAVIVSSHGGRNLDSVVASIDVLPEVVREVGHKTTVIFDSSIRRGSDMVKAYALGAKAVLFGRATLWGTAVAGEAGALHAMNLLKREYELTLGHIGCRNIDEIDRSVLASDLPFMGQSIL